MGCISSKKVADNKPIRMQGPVVVPIVVKPAEKNDISEKPSAFSGKVTSKVLTSGPCDKADAHGIALMANSAGLDVFYQPFRHPPLLDNEVRIKVTHSGLCQSDTLWMQNTWGMTSFPSVCGHEIIGTVTHIGEKVTNFQIGDRVGHGPNKSCCETCTECRLGFTNLCAKKVLTIFEYGGWATSFQSKAKSFVKVPENLDGTCAPLLCAGLSTFSPLHRDVSAGMKVGITGIGGLGHLGIMFARKMGCEVTAISTSASKEKDARELGAHYFVNSSDVEQVKKHERSLDYVLDTAVVQDFGTEIAMLKPNGTLNVVGVPESKNKFFHPFAVISKQLTLKASNTGSRIEMADMLEFCAKHQVRPVVEVYSFNEANKAILSLAKATPKPPRYRAVFDLQEFHKTFTPNYN